MKVRLCDIAGRLWAVVLVLCLSLGPCGCGVSKIKDIEVTSVGLESYSLKGFRAIDAVLAVGVDNPAMAFTITGLQGEVRYNGRKFAEYNADTVSVAKRCSKVYEVPCSAVLSDGVSVSQILSIARGKGLEGFTTDVEVKVTLKNGIGKKLIFKDMDIQEMVGKQ